MVGGDRREPHDYNDAVRRMIGVSAADNHRLRGLTVHTPLRSLILYETRSN